MPTIKELQEAAAVFYRVHRDRKDFQIHRYFFPQSEECDQMCCPEVYSVSGEAKEKFRELFELLQQDPDDKAKGYTPPMRQ